MNGAVQGVATSTANSPVKKALRCSLPASAVSDSPTPISPKPNS